MAKINTAEELEKLKEEYRQKDEEWDCVINFCGGTACQGSGAQKVLNALKNKLADIEDNMDIELRVTGCHGFCEQGPLAVIQPQDLLYVNITEDDVEQIIEKTVLNNEEIEDLFYNEAEKEDKIKSDKEIPFYKNQERIVFENNGVIDATSVEDYIAEGGYSALSRALSEFTPCEVIEEVKESGLKGRGGAGFPAGVKWEICYDREADLKYIICNANESDNGAYMDRSLLEGNPHLIIEGMIIGGYAIGASRGFIYVRTEYPIAVDHTHKALDQARELGFLGEDIFGSGFDFDLEVRRGAGAFVAGEETALMHSIEGKIGMPTQRPPFPAERGLWGNPTNINNVETWANVPYIINRGAEWFSSIGTENSTGTKVFSLVGKINNTGLIEVPMGITLREIIFDIGGGIPEGKEFKAVQTGGPSGGCIPAELLDLEVDFEKLEEANSMMGSGGMVVMDEDTCMVDVVKYFMQFLEDESCGKCPPCRVGVPKMLEIMDRITKGNGGPEDLEKLADLGDTVKNSSLCGLGQTAANPVLSTLEHFKNEYEEHIYDKACQALVCEDLLYYNIIEEECRSCDQCKQACPVDTIVGTPGEDPYYIVDEGCIRCGSCIEACPFDAIEMKPGQKEN